jgi:YVTN family beta-propeller protein
MRARALLIGLAALALLVLMGAAAVLLAGPLSNGPSPAVASTDLTPTVIGTISVGGHLSGVAVNSTTNLIYVTNNAAGSVAVIDGAVNQPTGTPIPVGNEPMGLAANPNTNLILCSKQRQRVRLRH